MVRSIDQHPVICVKKRVFLGSDIDGTCLLLAAADKYNVPGLKSACESAAVDALVPGNASKALVTAHLHGAEDLFEAALEVFANEDGDGEGSSTSSRRRRRVWREVARENPAMMSSLLMK